MDKIPLGGYIKTYRAIRQHPVWDLTPAQYKVWSTILLMVNFQNGEWWDGSQRVSIPPGSMVTSEHHLTKEAGRGITRKIVQRAIHNLIRLESISVKTRDKRYTEIIVNNWPIYQGNVDTQAQEEEQGRDKEGTRTGHNVRREEGKNGRRKNKTLAPVVDKSTPWADTLDDVRTFLLSIQAPDQFFNETYWLRIDQWLGDKNSQVFYFEELKGYLAWCAAQNGSHQHKDQLRGFRNWLSTTKRWKDRDAQRKAIRGG